MFHALHQEAIKARDQAQALADTLFNGDNDAAVDAQALACNIQDCLIDRLERMIEDPAAVLPKGVTS